MQDTRYEIKMVFEEQRLAETRSWVLAHSEAFQVAYPPRQVNNLYFDTYQYDLLQQHLNGIAERSKLRFRWYGDNWQIKSGQLEIKRKQAQLGNKVIFPVQAKLDFENQDWDTLLDALKSTLPAEGRFLLDGMRPSLINQYQREYYVSMDGVLRVTLDFGLRAFSQSFGLSPNTLSPQPLRNEMVIEMKAPKESHQRLADALSAFPLYTQQNSKYLLGMENLF